MSPLQIAGIVWGVVAATFVVVLVLRSTVSLHEDDSLHLSAAESQFEEEQHHVQQRLATLGNYSRRTGYALLLMTLVLGGIWCYNFIKVWLH